MARFYTFRLGSIYFTSDGSSGGKKCKLQIVGADALRQTRAGNTSPSADGTPYTVSFVWEKGKNLTVQVETITKAVFDDLIDLINNSLENGTPLTAIGTGDLGDFETEVIPTLPTPFQASEFLNGFLNQVTFTFTTT